MLIRWLIMKIRRLMILIRWLIIMKTIEDVDQVADDDDEDDLVQGGLDGDIESGQVGHIGETGKVVREVGHLKQHHLSDD